MLFYSAFILDLYVINGGLSSNDHRQGEGSVAAGIRSSVPSQPTPNDGVAPDDGRPESSGSPLLYWASTFFVVCSCRRVCCFYTGETCHEHENMTCNHEHSCCQSATCYNKGLCSKVSCHKEINGSFPSDCNDKNCALIRYCESNASYCLWDKGHGQIVSCEECLNGTDAYVLKPEIYTVPSGRIKTQRILS